MEDYRWRRERDIGCVWVCVYVCVSEREREERETDRQTDRERDFKRGDTSVACKTDEILRYFLHTCNYNVIFDMQSVI